MKFELNKFCACLVILLPLMSLSVVPTMADASYSRNPQVAVDSSGNIVVVWETVEKDNVVIKSISGTTRGRWSSPRVISGGFSNNKTPEIVINTVGAASLWQYYDETRHTACVGGAMLPHGAADWATATVSDSEKDAIADLKMATNECGDVVGVWASEDLINNSIQIKGVVGCIPTVSWDTPKNLSK